MAFLIKPLGAPIVIGFHGGERARYFEKLGVEETLSATKERLTQMYGEAFSSFVDESVSIVTEWGENPWTLGAYSAALPHRSAERQILARPIMDRIFFAGEACGPIELNGSLGAAYSSGLSVASAIHQSLKMALVHSADP